MSIEPRPLTAERRAEIYKNAESRAGIENISGSDIQALIDELSHAEQRIAGLEAALRAVGPDEVPVLEPGDVDCMHCGAYVDSPDLEDHSIECPWRIAREALGEKP